MTKGIKAKVRAYFLEPVSSNYQQINSFFNGSFWEAYKKQCKNCKLEGKELLKECENDYAIVKEGVEGISKLIDSKLKDAKEFKKLCLFARAEINI